MLKAFRGLSGWGSPLACGKGATVKRFRTRILVLLGVLAVSAISTPEAFAGTALSFGANFTRDVSLSDQQLSELQEEVYAYPDVYGGLWVDATTHLVTLYVAPGATTSRQDNAANRFARIGSATDPKAGTGPKKWGPISTIQRGPSLLALNGLFSKVTSAQPWAADTRGNLLSWYVNQKRQRLVIGLDHVTPSIEADAQATFAGLADLTLEKPASVHDRNHDSQPWKGGDGIVTSSDGQCTAGFETYNSAGTQVHYGIYTAGHCFPAGSTVQQGYIDSSGVLHTYGPVGSVTLRSHAQNQADSEFLDATAVSANVSPPQIWAELAQPSFSHLLQVHSWGRATLGEPLCFSGSATHENCSAIVDATEQCEQFPNQPLYCHLVRVHSSNGTVLATFGDSGCPVETHDSQNGVVAFGTDTGGDSVQNEWFTDLVDGMNALNIGLVTTSSFGDTLFWNQAMSAGQFLLSANGAYEAVMQGDGNFVLYGPHGATWNSGTQGHPNDYILMQSDGNLVIYRQGGGTYDWNSGTQGNPYSWLSMQGDGNLVIYKQGGIAIWHRP